MSENTQSNIEPSDFELWLNIIFSLEVSTYVAIASAIILFLSFVSVLVRFLRS